MDKQRMYEEILRRNLGTIHRRLYLLEVSYSKTGILSQQALDQVADEVMTLPESLLEEANRPDRPF